MGGLFLPAYLGVDDVANCQQTLIRLLFITLISVTPHDNKVMYIIGNAVRQAILKDVPPSRRWVEFPASLGQQVLVRRALGRSELDLVRGAIATLETQLGSNACVLGLDTMYRLDLLEHRMEFQIRVQAIVRRTATIRRRRAWAAASGAANC